MSQANPYRATVPQGGLPEGADTRRRNRLAAAALALAIVAVVVDALSGFASRLVLELVGPEAGPEQIYLVPLLLGTIVFLFNVVALALGIKAVRRPTGRATSAAAIALGAAGLFGLIVARAANWLVLPLFYP